MIKLKYMNDNVYLPYQDMIPDIVDGLTPIQRTVFNAVKILDDTGMLQYVQTIFQGMVQTAYIVGCAINRKIDTGTPYEKITDTAVKSTLSDLYYDEVVRLAAGWQKSCPFIDYQGNFGSLQGDAPACMLYTQIKQSNFAKFATGPNDNDVDIAIKKFSDLNRPLFFRIPNLLINGFVFSVSSAFAAFFAPHNIVESCDAVLAYLGNPRISIRKLMTYLKGPDFPTGGLIESGNLLEIYKTGYGDIDVYADVVMEDSLILDDAGYISRLYFRTPYMADFHQIQKELDLIISSHSINGLVNARYEYKDFLDQGFCVDIEKSVDRIVAVKEIYNMTHLKNRITINNLAYVDGIPQRLNLKDIIRLFVDKYDQAISYYYQDGNIVLKSYLKRDMIDAKETYQTPRKTQIIHSIDDYLTSFLCHNLA